MIVTKAMIEVYVIVTEYNGKCSHPTRKNAQPGWQYIQIIKQWDARGHLERIYLHTVFGKKSYLIALMGKSLLMWEDGLSKAGTRDGSGIYRS